MLGLCLPLGVGLIGTRPSSALAGPPAEGPQLTRAPELVRFVEATVPPEAERPGETAAVGLRLSIGIDGKVQAAEVIESAGPALDEAARRAALQFRFTPAEVDGKPSPIRIVYRYRFSFEPEAPPVAGFEGVVRNREGGSPLPGVEVSLEVAGGAPLTATTDAQGRFSFEGLPPGTATVVLRGDRLPETRLQETLEAGQRLDVAYDVALQPLPEQVDEPTDDLEIVVVAPPVRREVVSTSVAAEQARKVPGTSGDVVRVVESLPGVARSAAGSGALVVWGSSPADTRVYVDGVPIPRLYHEGGLRSVVDPWLVSTIDLVPGGYGAAWGRGLGGMVAVSTATKDRERVGGQVRADILDAAAVVTTPLGKRKRVHLTTAARGSYVRPWADRFFGRDATALIPVPSYGDGQLRLRVKPNSRDVIETVGLVSIDRFSRGVPNPDPALQVGQTRQTDFARLYSRWTRDDGKGAVLSVTPYVGYTRQRLADTFGPIETSLAADTALAGLRASRRMRITTWFDLEVGLDAEVNVAQLQRRGSLGLPPREGDIRVFGQPPPDQIAADEWRTTQVGLAPYVEAQFSVLKDKLRIVPGLRVDPYFRSVNRRNPPDAGAPAVGRFEHDFAAEPRLAIIGQPHWRVQLRAATGLYRQMPAPDDLSAAFGNPALPTAKALHTLAGIKVGMTKTLSLDLTGFFTRSRDLAFRSPAESPLRARALEPIGEGRAYGVQALLRQELWKGLFGWVAYTYMRSERRAGKDGPWRLFDFDQTHVLTAVLSYELPLRFETSARLRYASGMPRTPVVDAYYDATRNRYQPVFGEHNSIRIPDFVQLDLRLAKVFDIAKTELTVFVEVLNVWNQRNPEELIYSPDYRQRRSITGFPVLPVLGVQWEF